MPREPVRATQPDSVVNITVQVPGWFKNEILDLCQKLDVPISQWIVAQLRAGLRKGRGLPPVPKAHGPLLTPAEVVRAYAHGEHLVAPCGKPVPCPGMDVEREELNGMEFCGSCGIRFR